MPERHQAETLTPSPPKLIEAFESLEDPRRQASCAYPLDEMLLTALCAVISGADDWVSVALWGREKLDWLQRFLPFAKGIASHDTFSRVFSLIDADKFEQCFIAWIGYLCPQLQSQVIHIDGKSLRGSHDGEAPMAHLVSAWDSAVGLTLGQVRTATKSNEITAIPQLLDLLDVRGATVTIDAMGCQREVIKKIVERGADYIIAVKNNQPTLAQAVESAFSAEVHDLNEGRLQQDTTVTKDHGRLETRRCVLSRDLNPLGKELAAVWPSIRSLVMVHSQREFINGLQAGEASSEWRYYISSRDDLSAAEFNQQVRAHWAIENNCHWVLDVAFGEDASRIRVGDGAQNFAILRRMSLNLINQNKTIKGSKKSKRHLAAWSTTHLQTLLGLQEMPAPSSS